MNNEEFLTYKKNTIKTLKQYREDIEEYPDASWLNLQILWDDHKEVCEKWIKEEGYPSYPKGAHYFLYAVDKELLCIVDHLGETGEWRVSCAARHLDDLLENIDK